MSRAIWLSTRSIRHNTTCLKGSLPKVSLCRWQSSSASIGLTSSKDAQSIKPAATITSPMTLVTTRSLLRTIAMSVFLTRPVLLKPGMAIMRLIANSKSSFLNPDRNPFLRAFIKPLIYDQFCAGTNKSEIQQTVNGIKALGFSGVILCYGREIQLDQQGSALGSHRNREAQILEWRDGNLKTLEMLHEGNWLGIKFTGAGEDVTEALLRGEYPPEQFSQAMDEIAKKAKSQNCRIWIDAEQQVLQCGIDRWTISLMRKFNTGKDVLIYNTIQAYLKQSRPKLRYQLGLAQKEGWNLGVKLVRGAYIANEIRERIHDTKAGTDASYDGIVRDLLPGKFEDLTPEKFPYMRLFLAGHNSYSVRNALKLANELSERGELKVCPEFGQLQGMADDIGCEIVKFREHLQSQRLHSAHQRFEPHAYKCLTWGSIQECMQYLIRRAVENSAAIDRMREGAAQAQKELWRRLFVRDS